VKLRHCRKHKVSSVTSLRRERILVQSNLAAGKARSGSTDVGRGLTISHRIDPDIHKFAAKLSITPSYATPITF